MDHPTLKIIVLGDSGVGKSSVLSRYVNNTFSNVFRTTMGADYFTKLSAVKGKKVNLQIWDTAGQERFQSLGTSFYRGADCCVLIFDLTREKTFEAIQRWRREFIRQTSLPDTFQFVIIGNKLDLENEKLIKKERVLEYCDIEGNTAYFEVSAKTGANIDEAFQTVAEFAYKSYERNRAKVSLLKRIRLEAENAEKAKHSCWHCW
ncbi:unnamed protein product [Bursaphelenchus xylophilus]|uniref:Ras-related protein Rab-7b n=1 Tax=Bursaphelenchus xylophilus TaxID=6326 RepID=A0A1I7SHE5_BURXY|nr:unnamed protein product [Bursaphelenchus xylophilus]CAG9079257.1 unnamed protein product [Bursaphelenchus xylophilus]